MICVGYCFAVFDMKGLISEYEIIVLILITDMIRKDAGFCLRVINLAVQRSFVEKKNPLPDLEK